MVVWKQGGVFELHKWKMSCIFAIYKTHLFCAIYFLTEWKAKIEVSCHMLFKVKNVLAYHDGLLNWMANMIINPVCLNL